MKRAILFVLPLIVLAGCTVVETEHGYRLRSNIQITDYAPVGVMVTNRKDLPMRIRLTLSGRVVTSLCAPHQQVYISAPAFLDGEQAFLNAQWINNEGQPVGTASTTFYPPGNRSPEGWTFSWEPKL